MLVDILLNTHETMTFQQNGASAHYAIIVRQHLNKMFQNPWIGTHGIVPWPARTPKAFKFCLWGHFKNRSLRRSANQFPGFKQ